MFTKTCREWPAGSRAASLPLAVLANMLVSCTEPPHNGAACSGNQLHSVNAGTKERMNALAELVGLHCIGLAKDFIVCSVG